MNFYHYQIIVIILKNNTIYIFNKLGFFILILQNLQINHIIYYEYIA